MTACFSCVYIPYPKMTDDRKTELHTVVEKLEPHDFRYITVYDDEIDEEDANDLKKELHVIVNRLEYIGNRNDVAVISPELISYLITGGVTWGDDPTDSYYDIDSINNVAKIYDLLDKWAHEDKDELLAEIQKNSESGDVA